MKESPHPIAEWMGRLLLMEQYHDNAADGGKGDDGGF